MLYLLGCSLCILRCFFCKLNMTFSLVEYRTSLTPSLSTIAKIFHFCPKIIRHWYYSPVFLLIQSLVQRLVRGFSNVLFWLHCVVKQNIWEASYRHRTRLWMSRNTGLQILMHKTFIKLYTAYRTQEVHLLLSIISK